MTDEDFDAALIDAALALVARDGWRRLTVAAAAEEAGLELGRARTRFAAPAAVLMGLGLLADRAALAEQAPQMTVQERLFEMVMGRLDVFQARRAGVLALLEALPFDPATALLLSAATWRSMAWLLEAAHVSTRGPLGVLRVQGMVAVWLWTLRTWRSDGSEDLAATMATLDAALARASQVARSLPGAAADPLAVDAAAAHVSTGSEAEGIPP